MSRRVYAGGGGGFLRVSKAGVDAASAGASELMFSESFRTIQLLTSIVVTFNDLPSTGDIVNKVRRVSHSDYGFIPLVFTGSYGTSGDYGQCYIYRQTQTYFDIFNGDANYTFKFFLLTAEM